MTEACFLAADVGGTKTLLQICCHDPQAPYGMTVLAEQRLVSADYPSLQALVGSFLASQTCPAPGSACFAVAGPVQRLAADHQQAHLTNLPWELDNQQLAQALQIPAVRLINDFEAIGYSLEQLASTDLHPLQQRPADTRAPRLVVGAGTGLGVCLAIPGPQGLVSYPTEGGHLAFAPLDLEQESLYFFMRDERLRVSYERILSGNGLVDCYRFLLQRQGQSSAPILTGADPAAAIGQLGMAGEDALATAALGLFMRVYGAFTGDMALACLPRGGIYIAGGIAPKLLASFHGPDFLDAFHHKGRMTNLMDNFPVHIITNPASGLLGAAVVAAGMLAEVVDR